MLCGACIGCICYAATAGTAERPCGLQHALLQVLIYVLPPPPPPPLFMTEICPSIYVCRMIESDAMTHNHKGKSQTGFSCALPAVHTIRV